jgi:hypothetical protein
MLIRKLLMCLTIGFIFSDTLLEQMLTDTNQEEDCEDCLCDELPLDLWVRPSNAEANFGNLMYLDMSEGWSGTDGSSIYISVIDIITGAPVMLIFPLNDWFVMDYSKFDQPYPEPKKEEKEEEFDMEEYLKRTKDKGIEIKKVANSS